MVAFVAVQFGIAILFGVHVIADVVSGPIPIMFALRDGAGNHVIVTSGATIAVIILCGIIVIVQLISDVAAACVADWAARPALQRERAMRLKAILAIVALKVRIAAQVVHKGYQGIDRVADLSRCIGASKAHGKVEQGHIPPAGLYAQFKHDLVLAGLASHSHFSHVTDVVPGG